MRMRELIWFSWSIALAAILGQSIRAEGGRIDRATLNAMGLGGMTILSDAEATSIRGMGFKGGHGGSSVAVFGNSFADIRTPFGNAHSENGYAAEGKKFAKGSNFSEAGVKIEISGGHKGGKKPGGHFGKPTGKWGGKMPWGKKGGGKPGGGHHGGKPTKVISVKVFAGGFSSAKAH